MRAEDRSNRLSLDAGRINPGCGTSVVRKSRRPRTPFPGRGKNLWLNRRTATQNSDLENQHLSQEGPADPLS